MDEGELAISDPAVVKALYDPLRYRLFRLLEAPATVAELAAAVELPADRLYYHVQRLVSCGLVCQVDSRAAGRHTERVYGRAAARIRFAGDLELDGGSVLRGIADELAAGLQRAERDETPAQLSYHTVWLTDAKARELEQRLRELIAEYAASGRHPSSARRYGVLGVLAPLPESQER
ncbi:MAG: helix-turn-helix domain-containing protein [Gaiellaceae bacterium]